MTSTLAVMARETNSWRWPAFAFSYLLALAWIVLAGPAPLLDFWWHLKAGQLAWAALSYAPAAYCAYFPLFLSTMLVVSLKTNAGKLKYVCLVYASAIAMNVFAFGVMGWNY